LANYVAHLQPELAVNYCQLVVVWTDSPTSTTDASHPRIAIPYTFVLDAERVIFKIYNGWWYVGRPTVEELRIDLRVLMSRRRDWWYDDTPASYAQPARQ
jgi:hypothetical protein